MLTMEKTLVQVLQDIREYVARHDADLNLYVWDQQILIPFEEIEAAPDDIEYADQPAWGWLPETMSMVWGMNADPPEACYTRVGAVLNPAVCYMVVAEMPADDVEPAKLRYAKWASVVPDNGTRFASMEVSKGEETLGG